MHKHSLRDKLKVPLALEEKILFALFLITECTSLGMLLYLYMTI